MHLFVLYLQKGEIMFKKIASIIALTFVILFGYFPNNYVFAEESSPLAESKQSITYVAFGDSIAEGCAINLKTKTDSEPLISGADESFDFVSGSYPDLVNKKLLETYQTDAYNYAYSGDTCQDLINYIGEFYNAETRTVKNPTENNETYPSLTNQKIYDSVLNANIITVCIGANNVLGQASGLLQRFLGFANPSILQSEIEDTLKDYIIGNDEKNIKGLDSEFEELLNLLNSINPNAKIYFTNLYNPYKVLDADQSLLENALIKAYFPKLTQENLDIISEMTELVIGGGNDSRGDDYKGINQVIQEKINNFNTQHSSDKFVLVDSKPKFDSKFDDTNAETRKTYNNYVNAQVDKVTSDKVSSMISSGTLNGGTVLYEYFDPHPTASGHELIYEAHEDKGIEVYLPQEEPRTITISFVTNCEFFISNQTINENTKISVPTITRTGYKLIGWFTDSSFANAWNFDDNATEDMTLYAKWEKEEPEKRDHTTAIAVISSVVGVSLTIGVVGAVLYFKKRAF